MQQMFYIYQQIRFSRADDRAHSGLDAVGEEANVDECGDIDWEEDNNDSEEEFEANYEVDDENDDRDLVGNSGVQNEVDVIVRQHPFGVPSFMRTLDLEATYAPKFSEYANMSESNVAAEDCEFSVGMEFSSRESPQTFYTKCKGYGAGCDWLIRANLIRKKACWEIRRYNGKHTCTMGTISQHYAKLDSDTIADAIRLLVEADPSIKVKSIMAKVQSRFNYTDILGRNRSTTKTTNGLKSGSAEAHDRVRNKFTYLDFATKSVEESFRRAENIVVNRFDRRNEMFEVRKILAQRHYDCHHFQVERLSCPHVLACCANQHLDWQVYVHNVYKMSEICKVYRDEFVTMDDPSTWDRYEGAKVIPNWTLRHTTKGRVKSTRYLNEMDSRDMRGPRRCTM
ncbi:hypothetical protein Ahy_B03g065668 [Arachis hypogaea]|uniref:Transposase MuDR plant domain-containing protein n=1 Tax=Arachis hypogaea TaxID=3818 RepID=A0A445A290_ARAHY|nr:hypothetical protein Ahy_B03g065668 [Arachis hypogaea]